jgi:hypothetical protein
MYNFFYHLLIYFDKSIDKIALLICDGTLYSTNVAVKLHATGVGVIVGVGVGV